MCSLNVERQAYHGKSFVGNHAHKMLQHKNLIKLCNSLPIIVCQLGFVGTEIHEEAIKACSDFKKLFMKYSLCHNLMNSSNKFDDEKLSQLDGAIKELMSFFRSTWPNVSMTPKLHMLEDHILQFITKWRVGLGLYNEQGGEGIHPKFNDLHRQFCRMKPNRRRLFSMLKEHHARVNPSAKTLQLVVKPRKRKLALE